MIVVRILGLVLVAIALMLLGADALSSLEAGAITLRSTAEFWEILHEPSLAGLEGWLEALPGWAETAGEFVLEAPAWTVSGVLGLLMAIAAGPRG